jgi:hypothetical protein
MKRVLKNKPDERMDVEKRRGNRKQKSQNIGIL